MPSTTAHIGADWHALWLAVPLVVAIAWVRWAERHASRAEDGAASPSNIPADPDDGEDREP